MTKPIGAAGLALIKKWEGCRLTAYVDAVGVLTIGYGHTAGVYRGQTITQAEADALLRQDCQHYADLVDSRTYVPVTGELNANQRDALISFAYNCGAGSLQQLCRGRTVQQIAEHITAYNKGANGVKLQGLVNRRNDELKLYNTPVAAQKKQEETKMEKRYNTIAEIPAYARDYVKMLVEEGSLAGSGQGLDVTDDMIRAWLVLEAHLRKIGVIRNE